MPGCLKNFESLIEMNVDLRVETMVRFPELLTQ